MPLQKIYNGATAILQTAINASETSIEVVANITTNAAPRFKLRVDDEIMEVTAIGFTNPLPPEEPNYFTFTVIRGVEGTTAASHSVGARCSNPLTPLGLSDYLNTYYLGSRQDKSLKWRESDAGDPMDLSDFGTTFGTAVTRTEEGDSVNNIDGARWILDQGGTSTTPVTLLETLNENKRVTACFMPNHSRDYGDVTPDAWFGIGVRESGGRMFIMRYMAGRQLDARWWTSYNTIDAVTEPDLVDISWYTPEVIYMRMEIVTSGGSQGTTFSVSNDGISFTEVLSDSSHTNLTASPNTYGIHTANGTDTTLDNHFVLCSWHEESL